MGRRKRVLCPSLLSVPLLIALIFQRIFVVFDTKKGVSFVFFSYVHRIATGPSPLPQQATVSISAHKIIIIVIIK